MGSTPLVWSNLAPEGDRVFLGGLIAAAFFGHNMQELGLQVAHVLQRADQTEHVMAIHRANVVKAQLFKQRARHHHPLICSSVRLSSSLIGGTRKTFAPSRRVE